MTAEAVSLSPELNTEPGTQQAIHKYWLTEQMFWRPWKVGLAAALPSVMPFFLSWASRWKFRECVSEESLGSK